ncbi:hypothetical protein D9M71_600790 [compost metagenome]
MALEQVSQVHLVGAAQDGSGVVHHYQALAFRLLGEAIGVVIHAGGFANQQGVILGDS